MPGLKYSTVARLNDDGGNKNLIMFGGSFVHNGKEEYSSHTFKFLADKDSWVALDVTVSPPPREYHRMVRTNAGPLVFGGRNGDSLYDDLWLFSGNTWVQIKQQNSDAIWPLPRECMSMASNTDGSIVVMFGGNGAKTESLGDTWLFMLSNKTWVQISVPPKMSFFSATKTRMASLLNEFILIGGFLQAEFKRYPYVFNLNQRQWTMNSLVNTRPPPLKKHASGEVVGTACAVVHGGFMNDLEIHTDMWMYCSDRQLWQILTVTKDSINEVPEPRINHGIATLSPRKGILFGGYLNNQNFDNTYIFTFPYNGFVKWKRVNTIISPNKRQEFGMVSINIPSSSNSISKERVVCLFGGMGDTGRVYYDDTWCYTSEHGWKNMASSPTSVKPSRRKGFGISSCFSSRMLIFGGLGRIGSSPKMLDDLWEFNYKTQTWKDLTKFARKTSKFNVPTRRIFPLFTKLHTHKTFILYGGINNRYSTLSDSWILWFDNNGQPHWKMRKFMEVTPTTSLYASIAPLEDTGSGVNEAVIYGGELAWNLNTDKTTTFANSECPPGTQAINRNRSLGCELCPIGYYKPFFAARMCTMS